MISIKINGLDSLQKKLKSLEKTESVAIHQLFNNSFMQKYTKFSNLDELLDSCNIKSKEDLKTNIDQLNSKIKENSIFKDFEEMKHAAGKEHISKKLKTIFK